MLRLNIRQSLPRIGLRIEHSRVNEAHDNQATIEIHTRRARTTQGSTQERLGIDSYPSRHSYGNTNMTDFTRENGQRGLSDVQSAISAHAQESWSMIDNAAKTGDYVTRRAEQDRQAEIMEQRYLVVEAIPDPNIYVAEPARVEGEIDAGEVQITADVPRAPTIDITPGRAETYLQYRGDLRMWVTQNRYDIYA